MNVQPEYAAINLVSRSAPLVDLEGDLAKVRNKSEHDLHAVLTAAPELLCSLTGKAQASFLRKETHTVDPEGKRGSIDLVAHFYGSSSIDLIELKNPRLSLLHDGKPSPKAVEGLQQLKRYRSDKVRVYQSLSGEPAVGRLWLIGFTDPDGTSEDEIARLFDAEGCPELATGEVTLVTIERLLAHLRHLEKLRRLAPIGAPTSDRTGIRSPEAANAVQRLLVRNGARRAIFDRFYGGIDDSWDAMRRRIESDPKAALGAQYMRDLDLDPHVAEVVSEVDRILAVMGDLAARPSDLRMGGDPSTRFADLSRLADLLTYSIDGDFSVGAWLHKDIKTLCDLVEGAPQHHEQVADRIDKLLEHDSSEDAICAATQIGRYLPKRLQREVFVEGEGAGRWAAGFDYKSGRETAFVVQHIAYVRAMADDSWGSDFLNQASAGDKGVVADATLFNLMHAPHNADKLLHSLRAKAETPYSALKGLVEWHRVLSEALRDALELRKATS